jgi:3-(3-hydroxy-phenyl)propionate hydroxylase
MPKHAGRVNLNQSYKYQLHPFVLPKEMEGASMRHSIVIVGGGPVGLTLALELARYGCATTVIEAGTTVSDGSRAVCISERSMEILQSLGAAEAFEVKGLGWTQGTSYYRSKPVYRLQMPHTENARHYPMTNLQQYYIEQFLADQAEKDPLIEIRWDSKVVAAENHADHVVLGIETPEGSYDLQADYVGACDGARSAMRQALDLKLSGTSYEGRYLIADIELVSDLPTERLAFFNPDWNPGGTVLMHKQPDNLWRIDYQLLADDDDAFELQESRICQRIQLQLDMIGETGDWRLEWYSLYKAHCLCLDNYVNGRVIFCGDAAHLVPIFGVRGLNTGFADANNLAWKLAGICEQQISPEILASYNQERRAATFDVFENAEKSTRFMTPPTRGYQLLRDASLSLALKQDFTKDLINPRQSQPYDYAASPLNGYQGDEDQFTQGPRVGSALQSVRLQSGGSQYLHDHMAIGFNVLLFQQDGDLASRQETVLNELERLSFPVTVSIVCSKPASRPAPDFNYIADPEERCRQAYDAVDGSCYLLRPDNHVSARWKTLPTGSLSPAILHSGMLIGGGPA